MAFRLAGVSSTAATVRRVRIERNGTAVEAFDIIGTLVYLQWCMALNARLRAAREATSHKSAVTFAHAIGIAPNTVYRIENDRMQPSIETLHKWARECGVTTDSLLDGLDTSDTVDTDPGVVNGSDESAVEAAQ